MMIDDILGLRTQWPIAKILPHAAVFRIDNVVQHLYGNAGDGSWRGVDFRDLPNVAPLAHLMWLEWQSTARSRQYGVLLTVISDSVVDSSDVQRQAGEFAKEPIDGRARWIVHGLVAFLEDRTITQLEYDATWFVAADGELILPPAIGLDEDATHARKPYNDEVANAVAKVFFASLTAICFAHCKGVMISEHQQPRQQRRAAERAGRPPLVTYKTIDIAPATRILHDEGDITHNGIKKALHICRGHFAHYTEDRPLFGKYTGTFYIPMHLRGKVERGVVVKDYRVHPTKGATP